MEWIISKLQWLFDHPEVTWSGAGITILGVLCFIAKRIISSTKSLCRSGHTRGKSSNPTDDDTCRNHVMQQHSGTGDNVGRDKILKTH